ncbi:MAG: ChaN family lipoprotein [Halobacteriovoraceae bacterium]|nr:ChaN family lipoprotein [Halobacteriovoraceae bacterium]
MRAISVVTFLLFSMVCQALPLPPEHFLSPREFEPLWLANIEAPQSYRSLLRNLKNCDKEQTYLKEFRKFHCALKDQIISSPLFPDFNSLEFGDVSFFGETHHNQKGQVYLSQIIRSAPKGYFTTLALEMINEWGQVEIDRLIENKAPLSSWKKLLTDHWGYNPEGYLKVIEAALDKGLKIIALDDRRKERGIRHEDSFSEDLIYRDQVMAKNLIIELESHPDSKILALTGKLHAFNRLSKQPISVSKLIKETLPQITTKQFMLYTIKKATLFRSHFPDKKLPYRLKATGALQKYSHSFLFF